MGIEPIYARVIRPPHINQCASSRQSLLAAAKSFGLRIAVWAQKPQIVNSIVAMVSIDMVQDQREFLATSFVALTAFLALIRNKFVPDDS